MDKTLLLLTYRFPPIVGPQELRWFYFVVNLAQRGWRVYVLTTDPDFLQGARDESLMDIWVPPAKVFQIPPGPFLRRGHERPMLEWPPAAFFVGRALARQANVIISSVPPNFSPHLAAALLSRGTRRPWVADYGDPWVLNPLYQVSPWHRRMAAILERALLRRTRRVIVTTEAARYAYQRYIPELPVSHVVVVPCGYPAAIYRALEATPFEPFTLIYTGGFYPGLRSPENLFEALIRLGDSAPDLWIVGASLSPWKHWLTHPVLAQKVKAIPYVPHQEAIRLQKSASALLMIGNRSPLQIPGKLYEYIGARRPILAIQNGPEDLSSHLVQLLHRGVVVPNEPEAIAETLARFQDDWTKGKLDKQFDLCERPEWSWEVLTDALEGILVEAMVA
ncbi:MAG: glycosyltransferase [Anaerolineae bacterium]|nr:glycosyltransferase [Anaerolineae bacterium]MDW8068971.1 glycosyltransferase [Anaerolineae bacterium]